MAAEVQLAVSVELPPSVMESGFAVRMQVGSATGVAVTVKEMLALGAVAVVTTMLPAPITALAGTLVVMEVAALLVIVAAALPMVTVAPTRFVPLIVTGVPAAPDDGATKKIAGEIATGGETVRVALAVLPAPAALLPMTE